MSSSIYAKSVHKGQATDAHLLLPQVVINTRPVERAAPLTQYLQAAGLTVVDMPMLTLRPRPTTDLDIALMHQWMAGEYKALVIVSPTAAASGLAVWQSLDHKYKEHEYKVEDSTDKYAQSSLEGLSLPSPLVAVGEATAAEFSQVRIDTTNYQILQPETANDEGMLAMPEIDSLQAGDKLLIWRGLGGRRLLVDTLQARGVHIDSIAWYERTMPIDAMAEYQQWQQAFLTHSTTSSQQPKPIVVISSAAAFEHWSNIVNDDQSKTLDKKQNTDAVADIAERPSLTLKDFSYVVLGERLANMVAAQQLSYWRVEDLSPDTILSAINSKI
ncbi:uroporphyrinogen-III synthase [Psychrobacter sp. JCM 18900]|uniref:uroporphyrinogen-III synthase n=1 Tax=Psychrobacter sp. JCM 18900 TaxID=1298608 RepID=UPI0004325B0C|nr:uroporphyrinogen-III synthase [Psychrobacter sp. JCM 18900]GAF51709.1 uroporphyrinogen-III synthase [Psychrobacter sp. JCM 18900]